MSAPRVPSLVTLVTFALLATACASSPSNGNNNGLRTDGSVTDPCDSKDCEAGEHCELLATPCAPDSPSCEPVAVCVPDEASASCDDVVCEPGQHCELLATPCAPDSPSCEPVPACVPDEQAACTHEDCGLVPPTLPCADESVSQLCERDSEGECGWQQRECPHVGDPCTGCEPCPIPEFGECRWTEIGVCAQASDSCV